MELKAYFPHNRGITIEQVLRHQSQGQELVSVTTPNTTEVNEMSVVAYQKYQKTKFYNSKAARLFSNNVLSYSFDPQSSMGKVFSGTTPSTKELTCMECGNCYSRKRAGVTDRMINMSVLFKCPSEPQQWRIQPLLISLFSPVLLLTRPL